MSDDVQDLTPEQQRAARIRAARDDLARRYAADPEGVKRFEAKKAKLAVAAKRERERCASLREDIPPAEPDLVRPAEISRRDWKFERKRRVQAHQDAVREWNRRRRKGGPTPEQEAKGDFVERPVCDIVNGRRIEIGNAFCRCPRFENMSGLSTDQLFALRRYRRVFDVSEISLTKSALDVGPGGGGAGSDAAISRLEAIAFSSIAVDRLESSIPFHLLVTLRRVALHDESFSAIAASRFGSDSGQRRSQVRAEWDAGVEALVAAVKPPAAPAEAPAPEAQLDAKQRAVVHSAFLDDRGFMRPYNEIIDIILSWKEDEAKVKAETSS